MRTPCCYSFLSFILKFLIFLQAFVGVAIVVYSAYLLNQWNHHHNQFPPPHESGGAPLPAGVISPPDSAYGVVYHHDGFGFGVNSLPAPWFIYAFMGVGVLVCCITFIGHIGAEAINGCCLCFYAILMTLFILLEAGLVAFIALDHNWERISHLIPLENLTFYGPLLKTMLTSLCGLALPLLQYRHVLVFHVGVPLLFAIILRSLVSDPREEDDLEGDYDFRSSNREPLLAPYSSQASVSARGDSDIWSSRIRDKYGLNSGDAKSTLLNQNPSIDTKQ